jgi:hypothetical protein
MKLFCAPSHCVVVTEHPSACQGLMSCCKIVAYCMPTFSNSSTSQIRRRIEEIRAELQQVAPELMIELEAAERVLGGREEGAKRTYASIYAPRAAIELCLELNGDYKLTRKEVIQEILEGGFRRDKPRTARGLINDSIGYHITSGQLAIDEPGKLGRTKEWGKSAVKKE